MSLFKNILNAIFKHSPAPAPTAEAGASGEVATAAPSAAPAATTPVPAGAQPAAPSPSQPVDIEPILDGLAAKNSEDLDWKKSIVDLMKLVGMDSSLSARKELAQELNYPGDTGDSAAMNVWLHKAVLQKISENGGKVPAGLLD